MKQRTKIDSHLHCNFNGFDTNAIKTYIKLNSLRQVWLLSWEELFPSHGSLYINLSPEEIYQSIKEMKDVAVGFYAPDPRSQNFTERLTFWKNKGFKGCGELKVRCNWESKEVEQLLDTANNLQMPVIFHMENESESFTLERSKLLDNAIDNICKLSYRINRKRTGTTNHIYTIITSKLLNSLIKVRKVLYTKKNIHNGYLNDISGLQKMLDKYSSLKFIGHGPDFWSPIQSDARNSDAPTDLSPTVRLLSNHENLYADLSAKSGYNALLENKVYSCNLLKKFKDKLLYGTDNFSLGLEQLIDGLEVPELVKEQIFFSNANSFFDS